MPAIQNHGVNIKQQRSQRTYDKLIASGFIMMEQADFREIPILELSRNAGYSVGAFYSRFRSKDEFFAALLARHLEIRSSTQEYLFATLSNKVLVSGMIYNIVTYYGEHRKFWQAVLVRSMRDSAFWEPVRKHGHAFVGRLIARLTKEIGRCLSTQEADNIVTASEVTLGSINSALINQDGPIFTDRKPFIEQLVRAFQLISDFDNLVLEPATGIGTEI